MLFASDIEAALKTQATKMSNESRGKITLEEALEIAKARAKIEEAINEEAETDGQAVRKVRFVHAVVGKRPGKKRAATSGCGPKGRVQHTKLIKL